MGRLIDLNARDGPLVKIPNDPRATRFGRMLRATSIDELPQLWNVLNGTMEVEPDPRPALPDEVVHFDTELRPEAVLPEVSPGRGRSKNDEIHLIRGVSALRPLSICRTGRVTLEHR